MWPFTSKKRKEIIQKQSSKKAENTNITFNESRTFITIKTPRFFGTYKYSSNGQLLLAIGESETREGYGNYVIIKGENIIHQGLLPHIGVGSEWSIADEGSFVIGSSAGDPLQSIVYAFNAQGEKIFKKTFHANLVNTGISDDGKYAVYQLANNKAHKDGGSLKFFDVTTKQLLWQNCPERQWANSYIFDDNQHILYLIYQDGEKIGYTYQGKLLDTLQGQ